MWAGVDAASTRTGVAGPNVLYNAACVFCMSGELGEAISCLENRSRFVPIENGSTMTAISIRCGVSPDFMNCCGQLNEEADERIRYVRTTDGVQLAWADAGVGPVIIKAANWLTHLEFEWESPVWRHWLRFFSDNFRYIRYDERGCGMTDRNVGDLFTGCVSCF